MIVRPRPNWLRMLFVLRGSVLQDIALQLILTTAFAILVTLLHGRLFLWKIPLTFVPFSLIGLTLAIFLGFRNNTSYARYWEARSLWGALLNEARTLARQACTLVDGDAGKDGKGGNSGDGVADQARPFVYRLAAFAHALRHQLRGTAPAADMARLLPPAECQRVAQARYQPAVLLLMAGEWLRDMRRQGRIDVTLVPAMERPLARLSEVLGGCERIAGTPIPFTYAVILHRTISLYCLLLPFGLLDSIGPMTPVIVAFIAYTFFALEALAAELEEPFGTAQNDLALEAISLTIEATLRETLGERDLPAQPAAVDYVLR